MQALRGKNINDDDNQVVGLEMRLIEFDGWWWQQQ
jgi:hypothetical protein